MPKKIAKSSLKPRWEVKGFAPSDGEYYDFWIINDGEKPRKAEFSSLNKALIFADQKKEEFDKTEHFFDGHDRIILVDHQSNRSVWLNNPDFYKALEDFQ